MKRLMFVSIVATMSVFAVGFATCAKAEAATCTATGGTISSPTASAISFGNSIDVYATSESIIGSLTATAACTVTGNNTSTVSFTFTFDAGLHQAADLNRAALCTTGCGSFSSDVLEYYLCSDSACSSKLGVNGTLTGSCTMVHTGGAGGGTSTCTATVSFWAQLLLSTAGGTNDSTTGAYGDSVTVTVT